MRPVRFLEMRCSGVKERPSDGGEQLAARARKREMARELDDDIVEGCRWGRETINGGMVGVQGQEIGVLRSNVFRKAQ
jgi:hypothetical protein